MVPVPADHPLQQVGMHTVYSAEPVLLNYQDSKGIAGVKHLRSHRIVA